MDEATQMLLSHLAAGTAPEGGLSIADLVEQSFGDDPVATTIAAGLRQRQAAAAAAEEDAEEPPPEAALDPELADLLERLYAELEERRGRERLLADALGACERCFGEDELCPVCRGRGRPGGRRPDPTLFEELVKPVLRWVDGPAAAPAMQIEPSLGGDADARYRRGL